jgi:hypothetical protein
MSACIPLSLSPSPAKGEGSLAPSPLRGEGRGEGERAMT